MIEYSLSPAHPYPYPWFTRIISCRPLQVFSDWVTQTIRLRRGQAYAEVDWAVGPVPVGSSSSSSPSSDPATDAAGKPINPPQEGKGCPVYETWVPVSWVWSVHNSSTRAERGSKVLKVIFVPIPCPTIAEGDV